VICSGVGSLRCWCCGRGGEEGGGRRVGTRGSGSRGIRITDGIVRGFEGCGRDRDRLFIIFVLFVIVSSLRFNVGF